MDGHMFDGLGKALRILAIVALLIGAAVGAFVAWLVLA